MEKRVSKYDIFAVIIIVFILIHIVTVDFYSKISDFYFLYNRAVQMLDCLKDGNLPFFYYNDFNGVGYGSAFFYGHLTLYPFLPFLYLGKEVFLKVYILFVLILTYLGVCSFSKRYTKNYKLIGIVYMSSVFAIQTFISYGMYSNFLGVALGFFFLAKTIDFFRDDKSFIPSSVLFFLILNTHTISAVLCFIFSIIICISYFSKTKLKSYFKFAGLTVLLCSYNITNILYHINSLSLTDNSTFENELTGAAALFYSSNIPYGGLIFSIIFDGIISDGISVYGFRQLNLLILGVCIYFLIKRRKSVTSREKFAFVSYICLTILSIQQVWFLTLSKFNNPIQFPMRYLPYILVIFLIICFRYADSKIAVRFCMLFCLPELLFVSLFVGVQESDSYTDLQSQVINGEYLDESFVWNYANFLKMSSEVTDSDGNSYNYDIDGNKLFVYLPETKTNDITLTLPKLYYRGYDFYSNNKKSEHIDSSKGYSQFITVTVPKENKDSCFVLEYIHPLWLKLLCFADYLLVLYLCIRRLIFNYRNNNCSFAK